MSEVGDSYVENLNQSGDAYNAPEAEENGLGSSQGEEVEGDLSRISDSVRHPLDFLDMNGHFNVFFDEARSILEEVRNKFFTAAKELSSFDGKFDDETMRLFHESMIHVDTLFHFITDQQGLWAQEPPQRTDVVNFISIVNNKAAVINASLAVSINNFDVILDGFIPPYLEDLSSSVEVFCEGERFGTLISNFRIACLSIFGGLSTEEEAKKWLSRSLDSDTKKLRLPHPGFGVLIVDDEEDIADPIKNAVLNAGGRGFVVLFPCENLLVELDQHPEISAVLLDHNLDPGRKGHQYVEYFRNPTMKRSPLIILHTNDKGRLGQEKRTYKEKGVTEIVGKGDFPRINRVLRNHPGFKDVVSNLT